jgi:drug/metabolite transporter (DMT)-like permease
MLSALIAAVSSAANLVVDKITLSRERISLSVFLPLVFAFLFIFTFILTPAFGAIDWSSAELPNSLFLLLLMVVIAVAWNVLFYQSVQQEKIHKHELIMKMGPLVTILLAAVFFPEEFNLRIFILALIASLALLGAKTQRHHLILNKTSYNLVLAVILMSMENIIIRELLFSYSPVALYAVRTFFIAIFFWLYYRPHYRRVTTKHKAFIALSAAVGVIQMISRFYSFDQLGVIYTSLVSILAPIIVFYASWEILHEKIKARVVVASIVILICVTIATVLQFSG